MKYRHISLLTMVILMLVINQLSLQPAWLIPTYQNSKPLLMSRYTTGTHILFLNLKHFILKIQTRFNDLHKKICWGVVTWTSSC